MHFKTSVWRFICVLSTKLNINYFEYNLLSVLVVMIHASGCNTHTSCYKNEITCRHLRLHGNTMQLPEGPFFDPVHCTTREFWKCHSYGKLQILHKFWKFIRFSFYSITGEANGSRLWFSYTPFWPSSIRLCWWQINSFRRVSTMFLLFCGHVNKIIKLTHLWRGNVRMSPRLSLTLHALNMWPAQNIQKRHCTVEKQWSRFRDWLLSFCTLQNT